MAADDPNDSQGRGRLPLRRRLRPQPIAREGHDEDDSTVPLQPANNHNLWHPTARREVDLSDKAFSEPDATGLKQLKLVSTWYERNAKSIFSHKEDISADILQRAYERNLWKSGYYDSNGKANTQKFSEDFADHTRLVEDLIDNPAEKMVASLEKGAGKSFINPTKPGFVLRVGSVVAVVTAVALLVIGAVGKLIGGKSDEKPNSLKPGKAKTEQRGNNSEKAYDANDFRKKYGLPQKSSEKAEPTREVKPQEPKKTPRKSPEDALKELKEKYGKSRENDGNVTANKLATIISNGPKKSKVEPLEGSIAQRIKNDRGDLGPRTVS